MKRKYLRLILALVLVFALSACGSNPTRTPISTGNNSSSANGSDPSQSPTETTKPVDTPVTTGPADTTVTIEGAVLLDQDGLVITAKELVDDSTYGWGIKVLVENNSDKNYGIRCNSLIVNNYMISDYFSCSVAAGKKANDTIYLSSSDLEAIGIDTISEIAASFNVYDGDGYKTIFDSEEIAIRTSAYGTIEQFVADDGKELFNQDGIRIVGRYVEEDNFWGTAVLLFIENNYGSDIRVSCDNVSVNGFMVSPFFYSTVNNGRMALDDIMIRSSDLEDNDIENVEEIELIFEITNPDTYKTIITTDPITFSVD